MNNARAHSAGLHAFLKGALAVRWRLILSLAVVAVALVTLIAATEVAAQGAGGEAEVRIVAQRLPDGRTEFALQERQAGGMWGERQLPRARFFPVATTVGRWLSSSPLTVRLSGAGDTLGTEDAADSAQGAGEDVEVRIVARLRADGSIEFGLQQRQADGGWGERLLPRVRFFPAATTVERWLSSSPLTVNSPLTPILTCDPQRDRTALVAFYNTTGGAEWRRDTGWLSDDPISRWHGVTTNSDGCVTGLTLTRNELSGEIPEELGTLGESEGPESEREQRH